MYRNTDESWREYQAMVLQSRYRFFDRLTLNGNYTVQLRNHGNYEGEGTNTPGSTSIFGDYPGGDRAKRVTTPRAACRTSSATSCAPGRSTTSASAAPATCRCPALVRVDSGLAYSLAQRNVAADRHAARHPDGGRLSGFARHRERVLRASAAPRRSPATACSTPRSTTTCRCSATCGRGSSSTSTT